jgi:catechol 2,3-dioxygenase-like lactoylglutathione lyase family enzyme
MSGVSIEELVLADEPRRWAGLGFAVEDDAVQLGAVRLRLAGENAGRGILGWSLRGIASTELDGMPTTRAAAATDADRAPAEASAPVGAPARAATEHPNGIVAIDHVVAMTPALERSVRALSDAGLDLRRIREQPTPAGAPRQAFFRLGAEILEVVQEPEQVIAARGEHGAERPARLWGLAFVAPDLDRTVAALGEHAGEAREAVQPGRRIATVRRSAGLAVPVALMSPKS